jgi:hypothetical protein
MYVQNQLAYHSLGDIEYELDVFKFRRLNDNYVVSVDYCSSDLEKGVCSHMSNVSYYIEKQEYTLFEKTEMPTSQALRLLVHALKGFERLYDRFGYFTPSSKLVFFNRFHHAKVWIHQDLKVTRNLLYPHHSQSMTL